MSPSHRRMTPADWGALLFLSLLWGGAFFFNQVAVREIPPLTLVAARLAFAAVTLWVVAGVLGLAAPRGWAALTAFAGMGLLNNAIPFTLIVWGQAQIGSGVAAILNASTPVFAVLLAHVVTADERLTPGRAAGVAAGFAGVAVMMGGAALGGGPILAYAACLGTAFSYAVASLYGRRLHGLGIAPVAAAAGQLTASSLILVPLAALVDRPWTLAAPSGAALACVGAVAVASTALAFVIYFRLLARAGATNVLLVTFLVPVTAILLGVAVLGETLLPRHLAGMALIGLGLAAIDGRAFERARALTKGR